MATPRSYDLTIRLGNGDTYQYMYAPGKPGLSLGHGLLEPSAPSRVDTILISSLHHGYGREVATDPEMARDSNGENTFADTRQLGYIMPGGALTLVDQIAIADAADVEGINGYAAVFALDNGDVVFAAGSQLIKVDADDESVNVVNANISGYYTGSWFTWNNDAWLGVMDNNYVTTAAYNYDTATETNSNTYMFSWAGSTRNAIFWIRNRSGALPQLRWSDRTDQDYGNFNTNFIYPDPTNAYVLEIPKSLVTGAGVTGQYFLYATKGGDVWGLDKNEVFIPLTPSRSGGYIDNQFGGQMAYVGSWLMVPNIDGIGRFDPRNISLTDITPAVHQGSTPEAGTLTDKSAHFATPTPTGAMVAANYLSDSINLLQFEMYEDGMFWHPIVLDLDIGDSGGVSHVWGMIVTRYKVSGEFTSQLKAFILAADSDYTNWNLYKLEVATAAWSPGPAVLASVSGFRTGLATGRPPDINASVTQVRGYAHASDANSIGLWLEIDDSTEQYQLGIITSTGPFVLPVPAEVLPGRKFAVAGTLNITDQEADPCYLALPLSIDYRYVLAKGEGPQPDFFTLKFLASSDQIGRLASRVFQQGRATAEQLLSLGGQEITVGFSDTEREWVAIVEDAQADMATADDGREYGNFIVTLVCRRTR
jgi:hypothetical protein